ncbi:unnamed protein product [Allacma fusca]|uniref:CRAL-TRIO domain-containing protein n=2 Tax=Allacma fusca TaxID=39272 RepID=A0A8J2LG94_9HEXA|nr:unnamed protein product [Allacma fusca]
MVPDKIPRRHLTREEILQSPEYLYLCQPIIRDIVQMPDDEEYFNLFLHLETWEAPDYIKEVFSYKFGGYDYQNRPIWMVKLGGRPVKDILDRGEGDLLERYLWQFAHWGAKSIVARPLEENPSRRVVVLVDALQVSSLVSYMNGSTLGFLIRMVRKYRVVSKFLLGLGVGINISKVGTLIVNLLKPLARKNLKKIELYTYDNTSWEPRLQEVFGRKKIPDFEGTNRGFYRVVLKSD